MKAGDISFCCSRVREGFVELRTRISSQLGECGTYRACAEGMRQKTQRKSHFLDVFNRQREGISQADRDAIVFVREFENGASAQ